MRVLALSIHYAFMEILVDPKMYCRCLTGAHSKVIKNTIPYKLRHCVKNVNLIGCHACKHIYEGTIVNMKDLN